MKKLVWGLMGWASLFVACANEVVIEHDDGSSTGTSSSSGSSSSTGSSSTGSSSTSGGMTTECTPQDPGTSTMQPTCQDLDRLVVVNPVLSGDTDGDGLIEPGETASVTVTMKDTSGLGFNWYPGIVFDSNDPSSVGVEANTWFYAILPCGEEEATGTIKVAPDVAPGKTAIIRAHIDMINGNCTNTSTVEIPVKVQ